MISDYGEQYMPKRATKGSAGYDFFSPVKMECFPLDVKASDSYYVIDTGIHLEDGDLEEDEFIMMVPKSGIGTRTGFYLANGTGIIDSDYRGNIKVFFNTEKSILNIKKGDAFVQGIIMKRGRFAFEKEPEKERGEGGFGSTNAAVAEEEPVKKRGRKPKEVSKDEQQS